MSILLFGIVILELIFGGWFEARPQFSMLRILRDVEFRFDASGLYPDGAGKIYRRDRYGLRGGYDDPSRIDILAIGGSTTNEAYVGEGETWTDILAANFRGNARSFSVVNAGVDGHSTVGHLRSLEFWFPGIPGFRTRYLLAYVGINDVHVREQPDVSETPSLRQRSMRQVRDRSALYDLYRIVDGMRRATTARLGHVKVRWDKAEWSEHPLPAAAELKGNFSKLRDDYGERLGLLIARIRKFGAEPIVVTQQRAGYRRIGGRLFVANGAEITVDADLYQVQLAFNARSMEVCRLHGAICIDLGDELEFELDDFYDHSHTTPKGSRRIGDYLHMKLKDIVR